MTSKLLFYPSLKIDIWNNCPINESVDGAKRSSWNLTNISIPEIRPNLGLQEVLGNDLQ